MPPSVEFLTPQIPEVLRRYFGSGLDQEIESWPPEWLRSYQEAALVEQVERARSGCPFYQRKLSTGVSSLADLASLPFTDKAELTSAAPWDLVCGPRQAVRLVHTSTGTTGGPWSYQMYSWEDMFLRDLVPMPWKLMAVGPGDVVVNALPYEMSSSGQAFQRALQAGAGVTVVPVGKGGFYSEPDKTALVLRQLGATVLLTTPPYAMYLAELCAERGSLRSLWLTGEGCSPAYRKRLEQLWGCPSRVFYGSLECGLIALECSQRRLHICSGHVLVEIVDPKSGAARPSGEVGELVSTVLQRTASPLIRFRTRDLALLDTQGCDCGCGLPTLQIRGRIVDQVAGEKESVSPYAIEQVLYAQPEMGGNYQIWVRDPQSLVIDVELQTPDREPALGRIREQLQPLLARYGLSAEIRCVERIPRTGGKTRRVRPWLQE